MAPLPSTQTVLNFGSGGLVASELGLGEEVLVSITSLGKEHHLLQHNRKYIC